MIITDECRLLLRAFTNKSEVVDRVRVARATIDEFNRKPRSCTLAQRLGRFQINQMNPVTDCCFVSLVQMRGGADEQIAELACFAVSSLERAMQAETLVL